MSRSGIYLIINLIDGKTYIGQTNYLRSRTSNHLYLLRTNKHSNNHLQYAFKLYGEDNFYIYYAEFCKPDELDAKEEEWFLKLSNYKLYNIAPPGGSCRGIKRSDSCKEKIAASKRGIKRPDSVRYAVSKANRERILTVEQRERMSESRKGRSGFKHSEDTKLKLSKLKLKRLITAFGESKYLAQWSVEYGVNRDTITKRIDAGWSVEDAISIKTRSYNITYNTNLTI